MSSARSWTLSGPECDRLRNELDKWFIGHGVPQFAERYSALDRLHFLVVPLVVLVAFEIGAAPWFARSIIPLLVVPPLVVVLMVWSGPLAWTAIQAFRNRDLSLWQFGQLLFGVFVLGISLERSGLPPLLSNPWIDFTVILLAEIASMMLFTRDVWRRKNAPLRWLAVLTTGAVILFAVLFAVEELRLNYILRRPFLGITFAGLLGLACMVIIIILSALAIRAAKNASSVERPQAIMAACFPAVPLLVFLLAAEATVLREVTDLGWVRVWFPLISIVVLLAVSASLSRTRIAADMPTTAPDMWACLKGGAANPCFLAVLLIASLVGYPTLVGRYLGVDFFGGDEWEGGKAGVLAFGVYFFYFVIIGSSVWFGLDRVALWMGREMKRAFLDIMLGIAGGLPLLLIFAAFFALTAETWQIVVLMKPKEFYLIIGLLVVLTVVVLVVLASQQLSHARKLLQTQRDETSIKSWARLREHAQREEASSSNAANAVNQLLVGQPPKEADLSPHLTWPMKINALLVVGVFQAFVLVPVGFGAMALLWLVGRLAVPVKVAAEWTHGDNPTDEEVANIDALNFLNEPWTRVPVILSAFAVLYLTVQLLTDENHRGYFFSGASAALQQRLAIRIAYRLRLNNSSALGRKVKEDTPTAPIATGAAVSAQVPDSEAT